MKRVPKIPNAPGPRHYAAIVNDERVKPLLSEMLGELMRLQKRAIEEKNTKAKRRLVMGLREVARGIRAHKGKLVWSHFSITRRNFMVLTFLFWYS
jgi:selenocysteine insertion sequence-binding protein 2